MFGLEPEPTPKLVWSARIHGRIKALSLTREGAETWLKAHGCDGTKDGRCADWQDDGNMCNTIFEEPLV